VDAFAWGVVGSVAAVAGVVVAIVTGVIPLVRDRRSRRAARADRGVQEDQAIGPGITQAGSLKFVAISLADTEHWSEVVLDSEFGYAFERRAAQFFCIDQTKALVRDPELVFDLMVVNRSASQPNFLFEIGVRWTALLSQLYDSGIPKAEAVQRGGAYIITCHRERFRFILPPHAPPDYEAGPIDTAIDESLVLPDPIYLQPQAPFRLSLELKDYTKAVPNHAQIRFWLRSENGIDWSPEIELFSLFELFSD
jgi:hypothetical protein